jgi:acyl carrier protein
MTELVGHEGRAETTTVLSATEFRKWLAEMLDLPSERFVAEARLVQDVGLDSVALLEVFLTLVEAGLKIDESHLARVRTVGELYQTYLTYSVLSDTQDEHG